MTSVSVQSCRTVASRSARRRLASLAVGALIAGGASSLRGQSSAAADPRVGLRAGLMDAAEASWNMRVLSKTQPSAKFAGITNSDLSFTSHYAIQGSYNGYQIWDIANPNHPALKTAYYCPASQSDVAVYKNLLFVSGEGNSARLDCGAQGIKEPESKDRPRGLRSFDIKNSANPKTVGAGRKRRP